MTVKYSPGKTTKMIICGIFAAITAVCSIITIPLGFTPVPINLGTLAVFITGGLLGKKYGTVSILVYILIGSIGVPVFSGMRGGISVLAGPTGGYIIGYVMAVLIVGFCSDIISKRCTQLNKNNVVFDNSLSAADAVDISSYRLRRYFLYNKKIKVTFFYAFAMILGLIVCYILGTVWFIISTGSAIETALVSCVFPFIAGDGIKIFISAMLVAKLRPLLNLKIKTKG